jgi:hypothetical protein
MMNSLLHAPRGRNLPYLLHASHAWRLWRQTGCSSKEEEEKAEVEWGGYWKWKRDTGSGRLEFLRLVVILESGIKS